MKIERLNNMTINYLREFNDFIKNHRVFNITIKKWVEYPDHPISTEQFERLPVIETEVINCNGLSFEELTSKLNILSDKAIDYLQYKFADYKQLGKSFTDTEITKLNGLNDEIDDIDKVVRISNNIIEIKNENNEIINNDNLSEDHIKFIINCLNLQKSNIERIIYEYNKTFEIKENIPGRKKMGYMYGGKNEA